MKHKFRNGQRVVVRRLGDSAPADYPAIIRGIYVESSPVPGYIVQWDNWSEDWPDDAPLPSLCNTWDCAVIIASCIDPA